MYFFGLLSIMMYLFVVNGLTEGVILLKEFLGHEADVPILNGIFFIQYKLSKNVDIGSSHYFNLFLRKCHTHCFFFIFLIFIILTWNHPYTFL